MLASFKDLILNIGARAYESAAAQEATEVGKQPREATTYEPLEEDDEFKSIEQEILTGLSQISEEPINIEFDYDKDETITGDYEAVD